MKTWLEAMRTDQEAQQQIMAEQETLKVMEFRARMTPVVERLKKFIATIPSSEKHPRPVTFFSQALRPRHHGKFASQREVADALRQLGFTRHRGWSSSEQGFRSHWHFPNTNIQGDKLHGRPKPHETATGNEQQPRL